MEELYLEITDYKVVLDENWYGGNVQIYSLSFTGFMSLTINGSIFAGYALKDLKFLKFENINSLIFGNEQKIFAGLYQLILLNCVKSSIDGYYKYNRDFLQTITKHITALRIISSLQNVTFDDLFLSTVSLCLHKLEIENARNFIPVIKKENMFTMPKMISLILRNCDVMEIKEHSFYMMKDLEYLDLRDNKLTTIPADSFDLLFELRLRIIHLEENPLDCNDSNVTEVSRKMLKNQIPYDFYRKICAEKITKYTESTSIITTIGFPAPSQTFKPAHTSMPTSPNTCTKHCQQFANRIREILIRYDEIQQNFRITVFRKYTNARLYLIKPVQIQYPSKCPLKKNLDCYGYKFQSGRTKRFRFSEQNRLASICLIEEGSTDSLPSTFCLSVQNRKKNISGLWSIWNENMLWILTVLEIIIPLIIIVGGVICVLMYMWKKLNSNLIKLNKKCVTKPAHYLEAIATPR